MITSYNKLSNVLEQLLKDKGHRIEPPPSNTYPLFLLLNTKPDLVGFASLDSQPEENFSKAFQNFKDLYTINSSEWTNLDLTLVFCKTDTKKISDEFCNEIETDPYFCRKFVIDLSKDLKVELARLPFIPLRPETIVGLKRPISAQTFLMKHDASSNLARYLIVPHAKGADRIIEECLEEGLGKPEWSTPEREEFLIPQHKVDHVVRLKALEICNFRAYRESFKFDLNANLIVLFGPNGFGKTSFFDALDFVCTGGVARFDEQFGRKTDRLLNALKHLDSSINDSFIKLKVSIDGKEGIIERYMKDRTNAHIDGIPNDRTKTLMLLAGPSEKSPDIRIENLIRLFRATHLFGQEYQSLTSDFRNNSRLPEDTVSRMLALQDYVEGINKAREVYETLNRQIFKKESEISSLKEFLRSKEAEKEQLSKSAKIVEKPDVVLALGNEIGAKIMHVIGAEIEIPKELNKEIIRKWRIIIAVQKNSISHNLELIEKLEARFPELMNHRKKLQERLLQLAQKKELLSKLNKNYTNKKKEIEVSNAQLKRMFAEEKILSLKKENLNWLLQAKSEYQQCMEEVVKENRNYQYIQTQLCELSPRIEKMQFENKISQEIIDKITSDNKTLENKLKELNDLAKSVDNWQKAVNRHKDLRIYSQQVEQEVDNVKNELWSKKDELNTTIIDRDKLRKHIDDLQQNQSELRTLLDNIERYLLGNICPVCGTQHKSRAELIGKLELQRGIQPKEIQETLKSFEDVKVKTNELEKQVNGMQLKLKQLEQKIQEAQKEISNIAGEVKIYEEKAITLDIPTTLENLPNVIDSKKKKVLEQITAKQQELLEQKTKTKKSQGELTTLINLQRSIEQSLRTIKSKQNQLRSMIERINSDALTRQLSLEMVKEKIQIELITTNSIIEDLLKQIEIKQNENQNFQKDIGSLLEKNNILEKEIQELDKELSDSKEYIGEAERLINALRLNLDIDTKQILILKKDSIGKLTSLDLLQNEIINFEIALDAMETSVVLAKIQQDTKNINNELHKLEKNQRLLNNWLSYFDVVCKELEFLQNRALREYTEKYGKLTSNIQRRLRSVYGFGDINIYPEKGGIAVRVERKGKKNISPNYYFSGSQIQIVMLSLFLSATLTQTWSSFMPILLDDPVEHFDDLNAYSLLDLIRGLMTDSDMQRQFIISTCEDRLFRLIRQKFSKINGEAIFYVFESIGENGPKIKRL